MSNTDTESTVDPPSISIPVHVTLDAQGRLTSRVICRECGYNLRGLDPAGHCPECGEPIETSLRSDHLNEAPTWWLKRLSVAALCLWLGTAGLTLGAAIEGVMIFDVSELIELPHHLLSVGGITALSIPVLPIGLLVLGLWLLTRRDPQNAPPRKWRLSARGIARWGSIFTLLIAMAMTAWEVTGYDAKSFSLLWLSVVSLLNWASVLTGRVITLPAEMRILRGFSDRMDRHSWRWPWRVVIGGLLLCYSTVPAAVLAALAHIALGLTPDDTVRYASQAALLLGFFASFLFHLALIVLLTLVYGRLRELRHLRPGVGPPVRL